MIRFKRRPNTHWMFLGLITVLVPHASAAGICLVTGGPLFGGAILATSQFVAGCPIGLASNASGGAIITTSPSPLPPDVTQLTAATLGYSDPTGTINTASASLNLGTLGAFDAGSLTGGNNGPGSVLSDTVHFIITGGAPSATVGINVHVNGTETGGGLFNNIYQLSFGGSIGYQMDNFGGHPGNFSLFSLSGWGTPNITNETQGGFDFTGTLDITNGEALPLLISLQLACVTGETCDFSHTAAISFSLPNNVSFTSDSGVLLTQTAATAPEPASLSLIGGGLVVLGLLRKHAVRRRDIS